MHGMPSLWNMSRLRGSSSKASMRIEAEGAELGHRGPLEPRHLGVVAPVAHHEHVPPQPIVRQPGQRLGLHPQRAPGEQHDAQPGVEQLEQTGHLVDQGVVAAGVEEGVPVAPPPLQEVLATRGVGEHAVDVEDDRRPRLGGRRHASTSWAGTDDGGTGAPSVTCCTSGRLALTPRPAVRSTSAGSRRRRGVGQRRRVAEVAALGHVAQQPAHDLPRSGLRQLVGEDDGLGPGDGPDVVGHVPRSSSPRSRRLVLAGLQRDEGDDGLAGGVVLGAHHGRLGHRRVVDQRRLHLGGGDPVARDVHDVVDATEEPEVAVVVDLGPVAGEVAALEAAPVGLPVALGIPVEAAQHRRPGPGQRQVPAAALDGVRRRRRRPRPRCPAGGRWPSPACTSSPRGAGRS